MPTTIHAAVPGITVEEPRKSTGRLVLIPLKFPVKRDRIAHDLVVGPRRTLHKSDGGAPEKLKDPPKFLARGQLHIVILTATILAAEAGIR